jgi:predicted flap endonuclease-1-like 5' DNA nuclease
MEITMNALNQTSKSNRKRKTSQSPLAPDLNQAKPGQPVQTAPPLTTPFGKRDDLLSIEGIDPTTERALNSVGIRQFSDFRKYTPETLAQKLQARAGLSISAALIASQDWIGWAEIFATENNSAAPAKTEDATVIEKAAENRPVENPPAAKSEETPLQSAPEVDRESGHKQASSENLAQKDKDLATASEVKAEPKPREAEVSTTQSNGSEVNWALQITSAKFVPFEAQIKLNRPSVKLLRSEIHCTLNGAKALAATMEGLPLCVQIHAVNELTGECKLLASQSEFLEPAQADYQMQLEFVAPRHGRYQLQIFAFLVDADPKIAFFQGPVLRVIS